MSNFRFLLCVLLLSALLWSCNGSSESDFNPDGDNSGQADQDNPWQFGDKDDEGGDTDSSDGDFDSVDGDKGDGDIDGDDDEDIEPDSEGEGDGDDDADTDEDEDSNGGVINAPVEVVFDQVQLNTSTTSGLPIGNIGNGPLEITAIDFVGCTAEFGFVQEPALPAVIDPSGSLIVVLRYEMQNAGQDECDLKITSDDSMVHEYTVHLRSTYNGTPMLEIVPVTLDFGDVEMNEDVPESGSVTLMYNASEENTNAVLELGPFSIYNGLDDFDFEADFDAEWVYLLKPGESLEVPLAFLPTALGDREDYVLFDTNAEDGRGQRSFNLAGRGVAAEANVFPSPVEFGDKPVGTETMIPVTLTNDGEADAIISNIEITDAPEGLFTLITTGALDVPIIPGGHAIFYLSYNPTEAGNHSASLHIIGNFYPDSEVMVPVTGHAVWPNWIADPLAIDFGQVSVGQDVTDTIEIQNVSSSAITVLTLDFARGDIFVDPGDLALLPNELQSGHSMDVTVHYAPSNEGPDSESLIIGTDDDVLPTLDVIISGSGIAPEMTLELASGETFDGLIYFGEVRLGEEKQVDLLVGNTGQANLVVDPVYIDTQSDPGFGLVTSYLPPVPPLDMGTLTVKYEPTTYGIDYGRLLGLTNDPEAKNLIVDLAGSAINPQISIDPVTTSEEPRDFGALHLYETFGPYNFTVTNTGNGPLRITSVSMTDSTGYGQEFSFVAPQGQPLPVELQANETYVFGLTFTPLLVGEATATFTLYSNDLDDEELNVYVKGTGSDCEPGTHDLDGDGVCEYECDYSNGGVEACDYKDNNCDGQTDELFPQLGSECSGEGVCGKGVYECHTETAEMICSTESGGSQDQTGTEICDTMDNDCDGLTDEEIVDNLSAGDACSGIGECSDGVLECDGISALKCSSNPGGSAYVEQQEFCDTLDNDCDGITDEDYTYDQQGNLLSCNGQGECSAESGHLECDGLQATICSVDWNGSEYAGSDELCDALDNDCDGSTDEGLGLGEDCNAPGICGAGIYECDDQGGLRCSSGPNGSAYNGSEEICDNLDNDCDTETDETFAVGEDCTGIGVCGAGKYECHPENPNDVLCWTMPGGSHSMDSEEICDLEDNDCNGETDETFGTGVSCEGIGQCPAGIVECDGTDSTRCSANPGGSDYVYVAEVCDELDNDCDSVTDNGLGKGEPCDPPGECAPSTMVCDGQLGVICDTAPGGPHHGDQEEICDFKDNDCDGVTDDGWSVDESGQAISCTGVGACGAGVLECSPQSPLDTVCSTMPGGSQYVEASEICNMLDDDCDGVTDEGFTHSVEGDAIACEGAGPCGAGVLECAGESDTLCSTEWNGSVWEGQTELCDAIDNDCDGETDEDWVTLGDACMGSAACPDGFIECTSDGSGIVCSKDPGGSQYDEDPVELCNGINDDCDSETDEGFNLGATCTGIGQCGQTSGQLECDPNDSEATICNTDVNGTQYAGSNEICDGIDNDCDGQTDEGFIIDIVNFQPISCSGVGECAGGVLECDPQDTAATICSTLPGGSQFDVNDPSKEGSPEICDYLDNDCDGTTDNDFNVHHTCEGVGMCPPGSIECKDGAAICSSDPGGSEYVHVDEICDGQDQDCDGEADNGFALDTSCTGLGQCALSSGVLECDPQDTSATVCSTGQGGSNFAGSQEWCDEVDNDCDGVVDDGYTYDESGQPITCSGVGQCASGVLECAGFGSTTCSTLPGGSQYDINDPEKQGSPELCDLLDNDCNGVTDDGFNVGLPCNGVGACGEGTYECYEGAAICSTDPNGSADDSQTEICDLLDNDCDGVTDESFTVDESGLAIECAGVGECAAGTLECNGTDDTRCSNNPGGSGYDVNDPEKEGAPESCDTLDNDCDGVVDEGWTVNEAGEALTCDGVGECGAGTRECLGTEETRCSTDLGGSEYDGTSELCDSLDNNCDGETDEDFNLDEVCEGEGVCGQGTWECAEDKTAVCSSSLGGSDYEGSDEICDEMDNNCDGKTDEGLTVDEITGDPIACEGAGVCGAGYKECFMGQAICDTEFGGTDYEGSPETCNTLDDDCDGVTDDGFTHDSSGDPVTCTGIGVCGQGVAECDGENDTKCSSMPGGADDMSFTEICDSLDSDCDGITDDGFTHDESTGNPIVCAGVGQCTDGILECNGTDATVCSNLPGGSNFDINDPQKQGEPESCNGLDDDCDGETDEDFGIGQSCTGVGECGPGLTECDSEGSVICSSDLGGSAYGGSIEACNGMDDDCDGVYDEGFTFDEQGQAISCTGQGACSGDTGTLECEGPQDTVCSVDWGGSNWQGSAELCDEIDNDCDSETDEIFNVGGICDGKGECGSGVNECHPLLLIAVCSTDLLGSAYDGHPEACDGLDNDCDDSTDEDWPINIPCTGYGACGNFSGAIYECGESGYICSANPGGSDYDISDPSMAGETETCDGIDNDCDNQTDEDWGIDPYCTGVGGYVDCEGQGACAGVFGCFECAGADSKRCSVNWGGSAYAGSDETCDGLDNDCDGSTDEDFPTLGDACSNPSHACPDGFIECKSDGTGVICSKDEGGSQYDVSGVQELCNGVNDDCDAYTDEGFTVDEATGQPYTCTGTGACGAGVLQCDGLYDTFCSSMPGGGDDMSGVELCDEIDNDCDGSTDEDFTDKGNACFGEGECPQGIWECKNDSELQCSTNPGGSAYVLVTETCDGLDNDCDSETDEGFPLGEICDGMGICGQGVYECNTLGEVRCSTELNGGQGSEYQGSGEQCDYLDNNCDGNTDEGFQIGEVCSGSGECGDGVWECKSDLSGRICSTDPGGSQNPGATELCDRVDNNCDGETDEGFPVDDPCTALGECGAGVYQCTVDGLDVMCSSAPGGMEDQSGPEICDGLDNDCDGILDNGFDTGPLYPCEGVGECGAGQMECLNMVTTICSTDLGGSAYDGSLESCDGLDNDCDGETDEDFMIGELCYGAGQCGVGVYECAGLNDYRCSADPDGSNPGAKPEVCNGLDDDCDGETDEDWPALGDNCNPPGVCSNGQWECSDDEESLLCSTAWGGSEWDGSNELCDSLDNDCDGLTDEDFQIGHNCQPPGECSPGIWECKPGDDSARVCSSGPGGSAYSPMEETCNGLDDDCDGLTDDGIVIDESGVPIACNGAGECGAGLRECDPNSAAEWRCSTDPGGSEYGGTGEVCDELDNDCDGTTDEGFTYSEAGEVISCEGEGGCGAGVLECQGPAATVCSTDPGGSQYNPGPEICDGLDNDCDGTTDNGFLTGQSCEGIGECGEGIWECLDQSTSICSTDIGGSADESEAEICDNLDNDCDGSTDEELGVGGICPGVGACEPGNWECGSDGSVICSTEENGSEDMTQIESCDGVDNDCDGATDEDFMLDQPCDGMGGCGIGVWECNGEGGRICSTDPGGSEDDSGIEICDLEDNDCDGAIDEGWTINESTGQPLACTAPGSCGIGVLECDGPNATTCSTGPGGSGYSGSIEVCDLEDNDCDGMTDEGFTVDESSGQAISCDGVGQCASGVLECDGEWGYKCSTNSGGSQYQPQPEICDGLDNDCDGTPDNGFNIGTTCYAEGECGQGVYECKDDTHVRCSVAIGGSLYPGTPETCDSKDNDCDGETDEDFNVGDSCDGEGGCGQGSIMCIPGNIYASDCSTNPGMPYAQSTIELCDTIDNDCDGETDEDFGTGQSCTGIGACGEGVIECAGIGTTRCSTEPGGSNDDSSSELCNLIDDDCDGLTDEGWTINPNNGDPIYCNGTGGCGSVLGTLLCDGENATKCSADETGTGEAEICDYTDNNCDGNTDEGFTYDDGSGAIALGQSCVGLGACGVGTVECSPDGSAAQCSTNFGGSQYIGSAETCNGLDDDCDGETDEIYPVGDVCTGVGDCGFVPGSYECDGLYNVRCSTNPGGSMYDINDSEKAGAPETCDSHDNDCDGETDDGFFVGSGCDGIGECGQGVLECNDDGSGTRCSTDLGGTAQQVSDELCDGRDNDCDGTIDNGFDIGESCAGIGECATGYYECQSISNSVCSTHPGGSQYVGTAEFCDGLDNDCDGATDESFGIYSDPENPDSGYPGNRVSCNPGDGCLPGVMECYTMQQAVCSTSLSGSQYESGSELCNGADDNCNGEVDEGFNVGDPCTGLGACGEGTYECKADGSGTICNTAEGGSQYMPTDELCDAIDNDCDGQTDEDFDKGVGCTAPGICGAGFKECSAGGLTTICSSGPNGSNYQGMYEMCNDVDDDCDGETDEIYNKGDSCSGVGVCPMGTLECYGDYSTICSTSYGGSQYAGSDELCDSLDNDCDGYTDEMWPQLNTSCTSGGDCGAGLWVCKDDYTGVRCTADDNANEEICDGYDNDCNGQTDEDIQGALSVGDLCNGEGECGWGYFECDGFYDLLCSTEPGGSEYDVNDPQKPGDPESCDGKDNDCDGETDEGFDLLGDPSNCGECGWVCQFDNATSKCVDGQCLVDECGGDYLDLDGDPDNGCECLPSVTGGGACTEAYNLSSNLTDDVDGTEVSIQSTLTDQSEVLWYRFYAVDAEDSFCDKFHVFARFTDNPGRRFVMEVYTSQGGCSTTDRICPTEAPVNVEDFAVDFRVQMDYYDEGTERGECPCVQENPSEGYHLCSDNSQLYYLKVYYLPGTTPTCDPFELTVSNGWLSGVGPFSQ